MTTRFSLATENWVPVLLEDNTTQLISLAETFKRAHEIVSINTGDALEDAALQRFLLACAIASDQSNDTLSDMHQIAQWCMNHADDFDLLNHEKPCLQNKRMEDVPDKTWTSVGFQRYDFTSDSGYFATYASLQLRERDDFMSLADTARLLLVRHMFSAGGLGARLAPVVGGSGATSLVSLHYNVPFVWLHVNDGFLADSIDLMRERMDYPRDGTFHFTWPGKADAMSVIDQPGTLDVLTYPSRSLLIKNHGDMATRMAVFDGLRLPKIGDDANAALYASIFKHTTWWSQSAKKQTKPRGVRSMDGTRSDWQHILECYATHDSPSILSADKPLPENVSAVLTTMSGEAAKARIDEVACWHVPGLVAPRESVDDVLAFCTEFRRAIYSLYATAGHHTKRDTEKIASAYATNVDARRSRIVFDFLSGFYNGEQAIALLKSLHRETKMTMTQDFDTTTSVRLSLKEEPQWTL